MRRRVSPLSSILKDKRNPKNKECERFPNWVKSSPTHHKNINIRQVLIRIMIKYRWVISWYLPGGGIRNKDIWCIKRIYPYNSIYQIPFGMSSIYPINNIFYTFQKPHGWQFENRSERASNNSSVNMFTYSHAPQPYT